MRHEQKNGFWLPAETLKTYSALCSGICWCFISFYKPPPEVKGEIKDREWLPAARRSHWVVGPNTKRTEHRVRCSATRGFTFSVNTQTCLKMLSLSCLKVWWVQRSSVSSLHPSMTNVWLHPTEVKMLLLIIIGDNNKPEHRQCVTKPWKLSSDRCFLAQRRQICFNSLPRKRILLYFIWPQGWLTDHRALKFVFITSYHEVDLARSNPHKASAEFS